MSLSACYTFLIIFLCAFHVTHGLLLNDRLCTNGDKPVANCLHSQSGFCKTPNRSQPCTGSDAWNEGKNMYSAAASCALDYVSAKECTSLEWPIFAYDARQPPFRLLVYRHHTWRSEPALALNLSLAADIPAGIKFFFQHQTNSDKVLCRKFTIVNPEGYLIEEEQDFSEFDGLLDNIRTERTNDYEEIIDENNAIKYEVADGQHFSAKQNAPTTELAQKEKDGGQINSTTRTTTEASTANLNFQPSVYNRNDSLPTKETLEIINSTSPDESIQVTEPNQPTSSTTSEDVTTKFYLDHNRESSTNTGPPTNTTSPGPAPVSSRSPDRPGRPKRSLVPHILYWDCPMFRHGLEGEDFFLRLSDDAGWGAHLSFRVPVMERHDRFATPLDRWSVFHYIHLEHVTLEASVPVTLQAAPFPFLEYRVSLWHVCCDGDSREEEKYNDTDGHTNSHGGEEKDTRRSGAQPSVVKLVKHSAADVFGEQLRDNQSMDHSSYSDASDQSAAPPASDDSGFYSDGCYTCEAVIATVIVADPNGTRAGLQSSDALLSVTLPYQAAVGRYAVTVQILSPLCGDGGCYVTTSPVFAVRGGGYGRWVVVAVVVLLVLFLLSFTVMALIIRSQAEVASKKLWCRRRLLVVSSPYSPSSLGLTSSLSSFLQHTAAVATTTIHTHLADADPYQWMQYEMRTSNKVLFLVPPKGKTQAKCSHIQQQWQLGVLCYAATHGALAATAAAAKLERGKFSLLVLQSSGLVPAELSHLPRFNMLDDLVSLVTWLHDGTVLDRWFLWRPLVMERAEHVYKRRWWRGGNSSHSSTMWSGCRRSRERRGNNQIENQQIQRRDGREELSSKGTPEIGVNSNKEDCVYGIKNGNVKESHLRNNQNGEGIRANPEYSNHNDCNLAPSSLRSNSVKELKLNVDLSPSHRLDSVSSVAVDNPPITSSSYRYDSADSSSLNSSFSQYLNGSVSSIAVAVEEGTTNGRDVDSVGFWDGGRPEWVDEILGDREAPGGSVVEERVSLPVVQNAFAPTFAHLQEAVKLVDLEAWESESALPQAQITNTAVKPQNSSSNWLQRVSFKRHKHPASKPILDDVEEFSLYDNSMVSNATTTTACLPRGGGCHEGGKYEPNSANRGIPLLQLSQADSYNTLCNVSAINDYTEDVSEEASDRDESYKEVSSTIPVAERIAFDPASFAPLPNVSDLPLLGEDLVSPNTETSSCQVEDDDDDFTSMLFGGTV